MFSDQWSKSTLPRSSEDAFRAAADRHSISLPEDMPRSPNHPDSANVGEDDLLRRTATEQAEHIAALGERIKFLSQREGELQSELRQAHAEFARGEKRLRVSAEARIRECDERVKSLEDQLRAANRTIQMMQSTRVWRLGHTYWRARDLAKRLVDRGTRR
jgi:predicted RNase H-like nuclease (RuvC/YqgF family)